MAGRLIVNSDDFGLCTGVNRAVKQAHTTGVLTSATLMTNMPAAVEAVELAKQMPDLGVGVHLNLTEGKAVSTKKEIQPLLNKEGEFAFSPAKLAMLSFVSKSLRRAMGLELTAQIQWLLDKGINPTHLDSHKHIHAFPMIYPIIVTLAKRFSVSAIRWPFEPANLCGPDRPRPPEGGKTRAYIVRTMAKINRRQNCEFIKNDTFIGLAHTGKIDTDFWRSVAENKLAGVTELMTHPAFEEGLDPDRSRLIHQRKLELDALCSEQTKKLLNDANIGLTHYGKL